jgi:hypothetical protein
MYGDFMGVMNTLRTITSTAWPLVGEDKNK